MRIRLSIALALAAVAVLAAGADGARAEMQIGLQGWHLPDDRTMDAVAHGGVGGYRLVFDWTLIRPTAAGNDWTDYDAAMATAARAHVRILPVLLGCAPHLCTHRLQPPTAGRRRSAWQHFVAAVARRYGRGGTFWKAHPELRSRPLVAYQVWNEPNLRGYWNGRPDARAYLRLVVRSRVALRRVDPRAKVVLAGLAESRRGVSIGTYLNRLYRIRRARSAFDVVAVNAFARTGTGTIALVGRLRRLLDGHDDRRTPLWVTEVGWSTHGPPSPFRVTRMRQAAFVRTLIRGLRSRATRDRIGAVYLFCLQDRRLRAGERDWFGPYTGLFTTAGRPKPAWAALTALTGGSADESLNPAPGPVIDG